MLTAESGVATSTASSTMPPSVSSSTTIGPPCSCWPGGRQQRRMVFSQSTVFCCGGGHAWVYGTQVPPSEVQPAVLPSSALGASPEAPPGVAAVWLVQPSARSDDVSENRSQRIPKEYLQ